MIARLIATWFGCGYAPVAPGTAGSLAAIAIAWVIEFLLSDAAIRVGHLWTCCFASRELQPRRLRHELRQNDPGIIVVDEVIGQWITLAGATHLNLRSWVLAFALVRILDIIKPPPARQIDQKVHGGLGIVGDDAMAGVVWCGHHIRCGCRLNWY